MKQLTLTILFLITSATHAGFDITIDLSEELRTAIEQYKKTLVEQLIKINRERNTDYRFFESPLSSAISLAFVTDKPLQDIEEEFEDLDDNLREVSSNFRPFTLENKLRFQLIDSDIVVEPTPNTQLAMLFTHIRSMLKEKYGIKQIHSNHIGLSIGNILDQYGQAISDLALVLPSLALEETVTLETFKLRRHDGFESKFYLGDVLI